jgi:hypothetical protein
MTTTRRNLIKIAGGAAVGALFTPVPWRLVTDTALRSETWPGVPVPRRGEVSFQFGNCSLCAAGCAVRARLVAGQPVSLAGVAAHPLTHGALCAFGIAGHHLPYHPDRLKSGPAAAATAAVRSALGQLRDTEHCAVLDLRPGRTASWTYRRAMASLRNGVYLAASEPVPVDLAAAKTVLSLGAPLLDNWGTPGNVIALRGNFRLIQAEPVESRTAVMADLWLPIQAGSENALALGIANLLLAERKIAGLPAEFIGRAREFPPAVAALRTGIAEQQIAALARELADNGPALVLGGIGSPYAAALNCILGAPGRTLVSRREAPVPAEWKKAAPVTDLASLRDGSIGVLLIDESVSGDAPPWSAIQPKLADKAVVVTFAWSQDGYGRHATYTLPTAVYPESVDDIPPAVDSPAATFRLSAAWLAPPDGVASPADFIAALAGIAARDALRERASAIRKSARGSVFDPSKATATPTRDIQPDDFWKLLQAGATWIDDVEAHRGAPKLPVPPVPTDAPEPAFPLVVAVTEPATPALVSPLLSKLYRESNLRLAPECVALHPSGAQAGSLATGSRARFETARGSVAVEVIVDPSVPPGVVQISGGPGIRKICGASSRARVVRS